MDIQHKKGHLSSLDGVRGCAILLVLFFHCFEKINIYPFNFITQLGWVGVDLFFVLSGFLITGILVDTKENSSYFISFYIKRMLRIFPLYYLTLLLIFLTLTIPWISKVNPVFDARHLDSSIFYLTFTQNLFFSFNGWGVTDLLNHFWSLAIEEQFYLFWPFIVFYLKTTKVLVVCLVLIGMAIITRNYNADSDFSYVFTLARLDALAIGSMLAILIRRYNQLLNKTIMPVFLITLTFLLIISFYSPDLSFRNPWFIRIGYTLFALLFASVIAFIFDTKKTGTLANRFLSFRLLTFLGTYSYGIYHWLLYKGVYKYFERKYALSDLYIPVFLVAVVISFHTFEQFFLKFKSGLNSSAHNEITKTGDIPTKI